MALAQATLFGDSLSRDEIAALPTITDRVLKVSGPRHKPVPHIDMITELERAVARRGYAIVKESHDIGHGSKDVEYPERLFSTFVVENRNGGLDPNDPSYQFAIGMRRSNDTTISNQLCAGAHVFVCENGMFGGDAIILARKSTTGFDPRPAIEGAVDEAISKFGALEREIDRMKHISLEGNDGAVRNLLFAAFVEGEVVENAALARKVWDTYRGEYAIDLDGKRHEIGDMFPLERGRCHGSYNRARFLERHAPDCAPRSEWGLHNACTRVFRDVMPAGRAMAASQKLGAFFGAVNLN